MKRILSTTRRSGGFRSLDRILNAENGPAIPAAKLDRDANGNTIVPNPADILSACDKIAALAGKTKTE